MTNKEAQQAFEELHRLVAQSPLAWVLPNVDDEIQRGKPGIRSLEKTGERRAVVVDDSIRASRYEGFTTVTPFEPSEKLHLLTNAIEQVVREIPMLQHAALDMFDADTITFADDTSEHKYMLERDPKLEDLFKRSSPI